jgi:PKD repeat protein
MDPCVNDWSGINIPVEVAAYASVNLSAEIPSPIIVERTKPKIKLTVSYSFSDWEWSGRICYVWQHPMYNWKRMVSFYICGFKTISATSIGATNYRAGTFIVELDMPNLPAGMQTVSLRVIALAEYERVEYPGNYLTCLTNPVSKQMVYATKENTASASVQYMQGAPMTNFTLSPDSGLAALTVSFTNTTMISDPADPVMNQLTWLWNFGDGFTFQGRDPRQHTYMKPGVYNISLTATNGYGSTTARSQIQVAAAPVHAIFSDQCWLPQTVSLGKIFNLKIMIDNQGGSDLIDLWCIVGPNRINIWKNHQVPGYQNGIPVDITPVTPEQWLGYIPVDNILVTWSFYVAPSSTQVYSDKRDFQATVHVKETPACVIDADCPPDYICSPEGQCIPKGGGTNVAVAIGAGFVVVGALYLATKGRL